jgi:hypothetical protein
MNDRSGRNRALKRPRGVAVLALLLFLVGGIWLLAALLLPLLGAELAPWYVLLGSAAYFLAIGWGLWGGRRWAYLAALLMCIVLGFYQLRAALLLGWTGLLPLLPLLVSLVYLLRPHVRAAFLDGEAPADTAAVSAAQVEQKTNDQV